MVTLFEGYLMAMLTGMGSALKDRRYLGLSFFYLCMIVSAHYKLVPYKYDLGVWFYFGAGAAQGLILLAAILIHTRASLFVAMLAYAAIFINMLGFQNFPSHDGIWTYYYSLINTIQTLQIASLIVFSPASFYLYRLITGRVSIGKESQWYSRSQT